MSAPTPHPASLSPDDLLKQCTVRRYKASGPGGQHRNKVETAIELTHRPTGLSATATERRSQHDNQRTALKRLRLKLAIEHRSPTPSPPGSGASEITTSKYAAGCEAAAGLPTDLNPLIFTPSDLWLSRIKDKKIFLSPDHPDFSTLLAEALDTLHTCAYDLPKSAALLNTTSSQLIMLFKKEPAALAKVNAFRTECGLPGFK